MKRLAWIPVWCLLSTPALAHEGHAIPGALPPAPHGGMVQEAAHEEDEHHHEGEGEGEHEHEVEVFYEAVYKNDEVRVYPLTLGTATFAKMPITQLSQVALSIEYPRQKRTEKPATAIKDGAIVAKIDPRGAYRFFVNVTAMHDGEPKTAKIQIERE